MTVDNKVSIFRKNLHTPWSTAGSVRGALDSERSTLGPPADTPTRSAARPKNNPTLLQVPPPQLNKLSHCVWEATTLLLGVL